MGEDWWKNKETTNKRVNESLIIIEGKKGILLLVLKFKGLFEER